MKPGIARTLVLAVGKPAGWLSDRLPLADGVHALTGWLSPDQDLGTAGGGFAAQATSARGVPPVTPDAFDPSSFGERRPTARLHTLLITGDSMSMPLDADLARRLTGGGVRVIRDPHLGTGISKSDLLDWGKLSVRQARQRRPDAVVVFIGANEGFPMRAGRGRPVACCGRPWAAEYAFRVRSMMDVYRRGGAARVYWLLLPMPKDGDRARIARTVNAAISVAAEPYRAQVRVLDMSAIFTPGGRYRAAMPVEGRATIVRESDAVHLNEAGSEIAANAVLGALRRDFRTP
jgi:hypothetical protein